MIREVLPAIAACVLAAALLAGCQSKPATEAPAQPPITQQSLPPVKQAVVPPEERAQLHALIAAGYFDAHADRYIRRFTLVDTRIVEVMDGFPRLTPSSVPLGVVKTSYEIDLDKASGTSIQAADALKKMVAI